MNMGIDKKELGYIAIITIVIFLFTCLKCYAYTKPDYVLQFSEYSAENTGGSENFKLLYDLPNDLISKADNSIVPVQIKLLGAFGLADGVRIFDHEIVGHGTVARKLHLKHSYHFRLKQGTSTTDVTYIDGTLSLEEIAYLKLNGVMAEKALKELIYKEQLMKGTNYKNAALLTLLGAYRIGYYNIIEDPIHDYAQYVSTLQKINPQTDITLDSIRSKMRHSLFDLLTGYGIISVLRALCGSEEELQWPFIGMGLDYNLYPTALTSEAWVAYNLNGHYIKGTIEQGINVYNEEINGFSFEVSDIELSKIKLDQKVHYVSNTVGYTKSTIKYGHFFVGAKYNFQKIGAWENTVDFFGGLTF